MSDDIGRISVELANDIERACAGKPTAAVYLAIGMVLGLMETTATKEPRRDELFALLNRFMDDYIADRAH